MTRPAGGGLRVLVASMLVLLAPLASAAPREARKGCLDAGVTAVLQQLVNARAVPVVTPGNYRLERLDVNTDHVELGYEDAAGPVATVELSVVGARAAAGGAPDGRGEHFEYRVVAARAPVTSADREAMLVAARIVDAAIPTTELQRCVRRRDRATTTRPYALVVGGLQIALVLAAVVFGARHAARGRRGFF